MLLGGKYDFLQKHISWGHSEMDKNIRYLLDRIYFDQLRIGANNNE